MPATRPHVERDAKAAEILDAAEERLLRDGYEATTMAAIAADAGVSANAVYWYFSSKDELLAAVMRRRQERAFARFDEEGPRAPLPQRALAVLGELDEVAKVSPAIHERARRSPAVAAMHEEFHAGVERRTREAFEEAGLDPEPARLAARAVIAMVEGVHLHEENRDPVTRNELVLWAIGRFLSAAPGAPASA